MPKHKRKPWENNPLEESNKDRAMRLRRKVKVPPAPKPLENIATKTPYKRGFDADYENARQRVSIWNNRQLKVILDEMQEYRFEPESIIPLGTPFAGGGFVEIEVAPDNPHFFIHNGVKDIKRLELENKKTEAEKWADDWARKQ